jgi:hypothetical protein
MTKIAYLECPTGIAGDMCLGALIDAGVPLSYLLEELAKLGIADDYRLWTETVHRNGQRATKFHVELHTPEGVVEELPTEEGVNFVTTQSTMANGETFVHHHTIHSHHTHSHSTHHHHETHTHHQTTTNQAHEPHTGTRHLPEIEQMILAAKLPDRAEAWSLKVFRKLAEAEGAVHGIPPEQVHFHEVGATDAIVDIVGTCLGFDWLKVDAIYCSALPMGGGVVRAAHGQLPVPVPAVLQLFEMGQVPIYHNGIQKELVTPTGAAIAISLTDQFGAPPAMTIQQVGLGAGNRNLPIPNILRLWLGTLEENPSTPISTSQVGMPDSSTFTSDPAPLETIALLETQIDDLNPQAIGYLYDQLFAAGALDVFTQAIAMKKSRPGILLSVICKPDQTGACEAIIFSETTTLGIRRTLQQRTALHREIHTVQTPYGSVRIKVACLHPDDAQPINVQPEYEDCAAIARQHQIPWREVHRLALQSWFGQG